MFEKLSIKNFRNFKDIEIELNDKNIVIGMNDVGKSNLLYALRLVFDRKNRFEEIFDTDFHQKNIKEPIDILVTLNISDESSSDVQKILANVKEARSIESSKYFYIRLEIIDSKESGYIKRYYWGMI
jgi:putative ATP-dependent endonuclease of OLD family